MPWGRREEGGREREKVCSHERRKRRRKKKKKRRKKKKKETGARGDGEHGRSHTAKESWRKISPASKPSTSTPVELILHQLNRENSS